MFQRIVCFKFKDGIEAASIEKHLRDFGRLQDLIPCIRQYRAGRSVPGNQQKPPEYDSVHYLTFSSLEERQTYIDHEAHQSFIESNKPAWEKVFVIDSEIDES